MKIIEEKKYVIYSIILFLLMFIFYTRVEPIMVCDPDDWTYISYIRTPIPLWRNWNPAKILPESIMGLLGYLSVYLIYPITKDYLTSFMYVYAFVISFIICVYIIMVAKTIKYIFEQSDVESIVISFLGFLLHFILFRSPSGETSKFLFTASNLNCFLNYLFPSLLNSVLALWVIRVEIASNSKDDICTTVKKKKDVKIALNIGFLITLLYFAVFSNMACNIILIAPCMYIFINRIFKCLKENKNRKTSFNHFLKRNVLLLYIFLLELVCLVFEANGGRAASFDVCWQESLLITIKDLTMVLLRLNKVVCGGILLVLISAVALALTGRKSKKECNIRKFFSITIFSFGFVMLYMFILFSRIGDNKIVRSENVLTMSIWGIVIVLGALAYILKRINYTAVFIPLIVSLLFIYACGGNYEPSISYYDGNTSLCLRVNENIIQQFINADSQRLDEVELHIPEKGLGNYSFSGERIATTLFNHGIVGKKYNTKLILEDISYFK